MGYPARLEAQPEGGYTVTFRDVPEAITQGDTRVETLLNAADALATAMSFYAEDGRPRPGASPLQPGEALVIPTLCDRD